METPWLKFQSPRWLMLFLFVMGLSLLGLGYFIINLALNRSQYLELITFGIGLLIALFGLGCIVSLYWADTLELYSDRLVVKTFLNYPKKIIYLNQIQTWVEVERKAKHFHWKDLILYTSKDRLTLSSLFNPDYLNFKRKLTEFKSENQAELLRSKCKRRLRLAWLLIFLALLMGTITTHLIKTRNQIISEKDLVTLILTVDYLQVIPKTKLITLHTKEYRQFKFFINETGFKAVDLKFLYQKNPEQFQVSFLRKDYERKISKTRNLNFWDKTINYSGIKIYQLKSGTDSFLDLRNYKKERYKSYTLGIWICLGITVFFMGSACHIFGKKHRSSLQK